MSSKKRTASRTPTAKENRTSKKGAQLDASGGAAPAAPEAKKPSRINWKVVDYTARAVFVVIMLAVCWSLIYPILYPRPVDSLADDSANSIYPHGSAADGLESPANMAPFLFLNDFMNGSWTFGEMDWELGVRHVSYRPSDTELTKQPVTVREHNSKIDDDKILRIVKGMGGVKTSVGKFNLWQVRYGQVLGFLFTTSTHQALPSAADNSGQGAEADAENAGQLGSDGRETGENEAQDQSFTETEDQEQEIVQLVRILMPSSAGFQLMEGAPKGPAQSAGRFLLPYREPAKQLAIRSGQSGIVSSAILELDPRQFDIRQFWEENGWTVTPEDSIGRSEKYRCQQSTVTVIATFMPGADADKKTILLVRVPDGP